MFWKSASVRLLVVVPLIAVGLERRAPSPVAAARTRTTAQPFNGGTPVNDNVLVPAGETCLIGPAVIRGGVTVEAGGYLQASFSEIRGSVSASAAAGINIFAAEVRGGVTVTGLQGGYEPIVVTGSEARGNLVVTGNSAGYISLDNNTVRGSLVLRSNAAANTPLIYHNAIGANLDCSGNTPPPTDIPYGEAEPNTVGGAKFGECAAL